MTDAEWFRGEIADLGYTQSSLARRMAALGDTRDPKVILRGISRMATGAVAVSGEMRVILALLRAGEAKRQAASDVRA